MTVLCPSCFTRYRYEPPAHAAVTLAECARCDERFPMREAPRSYVLLPAERSAVRRPAVAAVDAAPAHSAPAPGTATLRSERTPSAVPAAGFEAYTRELADFDIPAPAAAPAPPRSALLEFLVAVVPPSLGASAAYYLAHRDQLDPVAWSALGGAAGFLLGWGCLLWIRRRN